MLIVWSVPFVFVDRLRSFYCFCHLWSLPSVQSLYLWMLISVLPISECLVIFMFLFIFNFLLLLASVLIVANASFNLFILLSSAYYIICAKVCVSVPSNWKAFITIRNKNRRWTISFTVVCYHVLCMYDSLWVMHCHQNESNLFFRYSHYFCTA